MEVIEASVDAMEASWTPWKLRRSDGSFRGNDVKLALPIDF